MKLYLLIVISLLVTSCSSVATRSKMSAETRYNEGFIYYTGTRVNYEVLSNPSKKQLFLRYALGIPDLPLSMILDTALLPIDYMVYSLEKEKFSKPNSVMAAIYRDSAQMLSLIELKELGQFQKVFVDKREVQTSLFNVDLQNLNETRVKIVESVLQKFTKQAFERPSYERAGRFYFKGDDYLLSFRESEGLWMVSTLSLGGGEL